MSSIRRTEIKYLVITPTRQHLLILALAAGPLAWGAIAIMDQLPTLLSSWLLLRFILVQPIVEEIVFRGMVLGWLSKKLPDRYGPITLANLLTAIAFSAAHLVSHPPLWALAVLVPGLVFGYFRERYNALWPAIVLHVWYNAGFFLSGALLAF